MPRIRKKTSKRGTVRRREKIKHKISEHHKKTKKQARKDKAAGKIVQKKSTKDPGIPNNFPYKDQILAEVAEQRRQAAAEKQRRKEEKRAAASGNVPEKSPTPEDVDMDEKDGQGFDGVMSLKSVAIPQSKSRVIQDEIPAIPVFPGPTTLREVVQKADVVLHVIDARDPAAGMSDALVEAAKDKLTVLLNKADTVPRECLAQWLVFMRRSHTVLPFRVSSAFMPSGMPSELPKKKAKPIPKDDALGLAELWKHLDNVCRSKNSEEVVVAVTGVTNAGKSAVINSILGANVFSIYDTYKASSAKGPSTTVRAQEVVIKIPSNEGRTVRLIDTPGLQFVRPATLTVEEIEGSRARDILLRCRGRIDRLKDPLFGVTHIVTHANTEDLMLTYGLPAFVHGDVRGFLAGLARVSGLIRKRGMLDHAGAARIVLRDWSIGKLMRYTMPGGVSEETGEGDKAVLEALRSKKELRSGVGVKLVKMDAGVSDTRDIEWDVVWGDEEKDEEDEEEDGDDDDDDMPSRTRTVSFDIGR